MRTLDCVLERLFYVITLALLFKVGWGVSAADSPLVWGVLVGGIALAAALMVRLRRRWVLPSVLLASLTAVAVGFVLGVSWFVRLVAGAIGLAAGALVTELLQAPARRADHGIGHAGDADGLRRTQRIVYLAFGVLLCATLLVGVDINSTYLLLLAICVALAPLAVDRWRRR